MAPITQLIDPRCLELGLLVFPPAYTDRRHWELSHLWLTLQARWQDVPEWAKPYEHDHLPCEHHVHMLAYTLDGERAKYHGLFILGVLRGPAGPVIFSPDVWQRCWGTAVMEGDKRYYGHVNSPYTSFVKRMRAADSQGDLRASFFLIFQEVAPGETVKP